MAGEAIAAYAVLICSESHVQAVGCAWLLRMPLAMEQTLT